MCTPQIENKYKGISSYIVGKDERKAETLKLKGLIKSCRNTKWSRKKEVRAMYGFTIGHLHLSAACVTMNSDRRTKTTGLMCLTGWFLGGKRCDN